MVNDAITAMDKDKDGSVQSAEFDYELIKKSLNIPGKINFKM